jgi:hypothetical protein
VLGRHECRGAGERRDWWEVLGRHVSRGGRVVLGGRFH